MSSKNNVNKDFYTIAGRDRPNEDLVMAKPPRGAQPGRRGGPRPSLFRSEGFAHSEGIGAGCSRYLP